jgi:hypothetical protein
MLDLSLHIMDLAENGITAGANLILIFIEEQPEEDRLTIIIEDNGKGMNPEFLSNALDPFVTTRTTRKVGLGLSLFQQACQQAGGDVKVESEIGIGTKIAGFMQYDNIDRKPLGNMSETISCLILGNPAVDFKYVHKWKDKIYELDTRELKQLLEDIEITNLNVITLIRDNIRSGLQDIKKP